MYKVSIFEHDHDTLALVAYANSADDITTRDGALIVHDVDDEYLLVPVDRIGHVSAIKVETSDV